MTEVSSPKQLRVVLDADDLSGVARTYKSHLSQTGVFVTTTKPIPIGTRVKVELLFANGQKALGGEGAVSWVRQGGGTAAAGVAVDLVWEADSAPHVAAILRGRSPAAAVPSVAPVNPMTTPPPSRDRADERIDPRPSSVEPQKGVRRPGELWEVPPSDPGLRPELGPRGRLCIGIDLGTTNSCAAIVQDGKARVLLARRGAGATPSVVALDSKGQLLVGDPALRQLSVDPTTAIVGAKRLIGRPIDAPVVEEMKRIFAYPIIEGQNGEAAVQLGAHVLTPEEVAAHVLREIRENVSLTLGEDVNRAVITCPAYFTERQRQAIRTAGELAGLHVEQIIPEPTAAALTYGFGRSLARRRVLVYDLGGGTFDACLVEIHGETYEVQATGGDTFLGGIDFDERLTRLLVRQIHQKHEVDPREDRSAMTRLMIAAERAKRDLTDHHTTVLRLDYFVIQGAQPLTIEVPFDRSTAERFFEPLVERTIAVCEDVCARAGLAPSEVDDVILVGGMSRAPIVRRKVREFFGKEPLRDVNPDQAVALGAAHFAHGLGTPDGVVLIDVLPQSIGVGLPGGRMKKIVERDTKLPTTRSYRIRTTFDNQAELKIVVFQGEDDLVTSNDLIGVLRIADLPKGPKGSQSVELTFHVTGECLLNIEARVESTGKKVRSKFLTKFTPEDIAMALGIALPNPRDAENSVRPGPAADVPQGFLSRLKRLLFKPEDEGEAR